MNGHLQDSITREDAAVFERGGCRPDRGAADPNAGERVEAEDMKAPDLPTDRQSDSHDDRHGRARWRRVAQPRRLEAPMPDCRHRSKVDVLAHAAKEADVLHRAPIINEDLGDLKSMEAGQIDPRKVGRHVQDLLRHLRVAADTASRRGVEVARRRRANGDGRLRRFVCLLAAPGYDCERETHAAPQNLTHAVLGHRTPAVDGQDGPDIIVYRYLFIVL
jgi:hypothetical protein